MATKASIRNIPIGIFFIAAFYLLGSIILIISIFINPNSVSQALAKAHGLSSIMGIEISIVVALLGIIIAIGLLSFSRWVYALAIIYLIYFAFVSVINGGLEFLSPGHLDKQIYFGNLLWSLLVIAYLIIVRRRYFPNV